MLADLFQRLAMHARRRYDTAIMPAAAKRGSAMLRLFDTKQLDEFAVGLAEDLGRRFPPVSEARTDPGAKQQFKVIIEGLAERALSYHQQYKLGVYKKAKLGNVFRWKLKELGYSDEFVEEATRKIVTRLAVK